MSSRLIAPAATTPPLAPGISYQLPQSSYHLRKQKHRRTKTGCFTCRVRKVKCDENRPQCKRCAITGRKCEGFPEPDADISEHGSIVLKKRHDSAPAFPVRPSDVPVIGNDAESIRFFEIFHASAIKIIPGHTPMRTWTVLIPQLCMIEPAIAHASLAIAALHEETELTSRSLAFADHQLEVSSAYAYALKHYGKALKEIQSHLEKSTASPTVILTACLIFICFEAIRGQNQAAIAHIQSGNRILDGLRRSMNNRKSIKDPPVSGSSDKPQMALSTDLSQDLEMARMARSFTKLSNLIGSSEEQRGITSVQAAAESPQELAECPEDFQALDEARGALFAMMNSARGALSYCLSQMHTSESGAPSDGLARCLFLDAQLRRWSTALDRLQRRNATEGHRDASIPAENSEIVLLRLWSKFVSVRLWAGILTSRASLDALTPDIEELLDLCERCLNLQIEQHAARRGTKHYQPPVFILDMGVLPVLFFAGQKCSDRALQLRALRLLDRCPKREALWDGEIVRAAILRELESQDAASVRSCQQDIRPASDSRCSVTHAHSEQLRNSTSQSSQRFLEPSTDVHSSTGPQLARKHIDACVAPDSSVDSDALAWFDWFSIPPEQLDTIQGSLYNLQISGEMPRTWHPAHAAENDPSANG